MTSKRRSDHILALDNPGVRQIVAADTRNQLTSAPVVLVDEWLHYPPVWDAARRLIDEKTNKTFLFTDSASPREGVDTHSGAGRIISLRMRPFALAERPYTEPTVFRIYLMESSTSAERAILGLLTMPRRYAKLGFLTFSHSRVGHTALRFAGMSIGLSIVTFPSKALESGAQKHSTHG